MFAVGRVAAGGISPAVAALTEGVVKAMFVNKLKAATAVLFAAAVIGLGAGGLRHGSRGAEPAAPYRPVPAKLLLPRASGQGVEDKRPDIGFYPPDRRLIGTPKTATPRKEAGAASKARAKSFAKLQAIASIEANLKKLRESTDDKLEREALDGIERAVLWYKTVRWLTEVLSVEKDSVPFPTEKRREKK
jgi:hypothetical protein